jgi:protein-ribulosamine 3-kinase
MSTAPPAILRALSLPDPSKVHLYGLGSGFTSTGVLRAEVPSENNTTEERQYFVKTSSEGSSAAEMFEGEYASLNAISSSVPGFCPRALAWGALDEESNKPKKFFLATEFLDLSGAMGRSSHGETSTTSLASRLGKLHTTPAPPDPETGRRRFGFPVATFCGDTKQPNRFYDSWAEFYANERLLTILKTSEERNGQDKGLRELVEKTAGEVVPRLLGDDHLGYNSSGEGKGIVPVVVHGDLWSGNADRGKIVSNGGDEGVGDVVYDACAVYGHSEFELGIMNMFGGFGARFFDQYHRIVPKTEPVEEYDDRISLYEL